MNSKLLKQNYVLLPEFIDATRAEFLSAQLKLFMAVNKSKPDQGVPNAPVCENHPLTFELLKEKKAEIQNHVNEKIVSNYSYARLYRYGCDLKPHVDKKIHKYAISLNLSGDAEWTFWMTDPKGEAHPLILLPGQAVLYLAPKASHWRKPYTGREYLQLFLFYGAAQSVLDTSSSVVSNVVQASSLFR